MDEFKHGDYAEEGWRRVNECSGREDNSLSANLQQKNPLFGLPAAEKQGVGVWGGEMNASVYVFKLVHSRTLVWRSSLCQESTVSA